MTSTFVERYDTTEINIQLSEQDREAAQLTLLEAADYIDNMAYVMAAAERVAVDDMKEHFEREEDPDGNPWMQLTDDYWRWKTSLGDKIDKILQFDGPLKDAATSPGSWIINENTLMFDTSLLPPYGTLHQTGTGSESDWHYRESIGISDRVSAGIGRGKALPSRPFIGLSAHAEERINAIFDVWFNESVSGVYVRKGGVAQSRESGFTPEGQAFGGRFGGKL